MSLSTQTKILRVLQEHTFEPVGSEKTVKVDVRVIASTNKDLGKAIEKGLFREDLYYRLKVITIYMPPLRHKLEDISLLVDYFIRKFNKEFSKSIKKVSPEVIAQLKKYKWPGNVRELENAIQTAIVMGKEDVLLLEDFPMFAPKTPGLKQEAPKQASDYEKMFQDILGPILRESIAAGDSNLYKSVLGNLEKALIEMVLREVAGSQTKAVKILGISRNTLRTRMKKYKL